MISRSTLSHYSQPIFSCEKQLPGIKTGWNEITHTSPLPLENVIETCCDKVSSEKAFKFCFESHSTIFDTVH